MPVAARGLPFSIHQVAEYLIGLGLIAQAVQGSKSLLPIVFGAAVLLSADPAPSSGRVFLIGHPQPAKAADVLQAIADAVGRRYRPITVPRVVVAAAALAGELSWRFGYTPLVDRARLVELSAGSFVCSVARARAQLGFTAATDLRDGMAETWQWYRAAGWA